MPDTRISDMPSTTINDSALILLAQGGIGKRGTTGQIRQQGSSWFANAGTTNQVEIGAVGPAGEPGTRWANLGNSVIYRDAPNSGVSFNLGAVKQFTLRNSLTNNLALGLRNYQAPPSGIQNTAIGTDSLRDVTTGSFNVAAGTTALRSMTTGSNNVSVGWESSINTNGSGNTVVGRRAFLNSVAGDSNTAIGYDALRGHLASVENTVVGDGALTTANTSSSSVAVGTVALQLYSGSGINTAVGTAAMQNSTTGTDNVAVGNQALQNATPTRATMVGYQAAPLAGVRSDNTGVGYGVMANLTTGGENVAVGKSALAKTDTGARNVAIGIRAADGDAVAVGSITNCVFIGTDTDYTANGITNSTLMHRGQTIGVSNSTLVSNGATTTFAGTGVIAPPTAGSGFAVSSPTAANQLVLGSGINTGGHTVIASRFKTKWGGSTSTYGRVGGSLVDHFASVGNIGAAETTLYSDVIPANTLTVDGQRLMMVVGGFMPNVAASNRQVRFYANGVLQFDNAGIAHGSATNQTGWVLRVEIVRQGAALAKFTITYVANGQPIGMRTVHGVAVNWAANATFAVTGQASGGGAANNHIIAESGFTTWHGEPI